MSAGAAMFPQLARKRLLLAGGLGILFAGAVAVLWFTTSGPRRKAAREQVFREKDPPPTWNTAAMVKDLPVVEGALHVLAWEIVDDGERVLERCLVLTQYGKSRPDGTTCALAYLNRAPQYGEKARWGSPSIHYDPWPEFIPPTLGWKLYKTLPSDKEIAKFLADRMWAQDVNPYTASGRDGEKRYEPKLIDGGVCRDTWQEIFDREPSPDLFPELLAEAAPGKD
jgi:hypothetical protein